MGTLQTIISEISGQLPYASYLLILPLAGLVIGGIVAAVTAAYVALEERAAREEEQRLIDAALEEKRRQDEELDNVRLLLTKKDT